jgi:cob(I)alamin adenosyltransferase
MANKVYTKKGDSGTTSLLSGKRVSKMSSVIKAVGALDELNSFIGMLRTVYDIPLFEEIQWNLFNAGSSIINDTEYEIPNIKEEDVYSIERAMDKMNESLPELKNFILPKGNIAQTYAHLCRTICRRVEIDVLSIVGENSTHWPATLEIIVRYLNRLSDYFFVLARYIGHSENVDETIWKN